jgi:phenylacetate-CoA ligase
VLRGIAEVAEYRIEVRTRRAMKHLRIEVEPTAAAAGAAFELTARIEKAVKDRLHFHAEIVAVPPGSLPRFEGKGRRFVRIEEG